MKKVQLTLVAVILALFGMRFGTAQDQKPAMSFFVTSQGPAAGQVLAEWPGPTHTARSWPRLLELVPVTGALT
jgi:hypothetical protein